MRLTYKKLAQIVSDKLKSVEIEHTNVEAYNPRFLGKEIEGGAATIIYRIYHGNQITNMYGGQWISEIQDIINLGQYRIEVSLKTRWSITDAEIWFHKI